MSVAIEPTSSKSWNGSENGSPKFNLRLVRNCYRVTGSLSHGNDLLNALLDRSRSLALFQENIL